MATRAKKKAPRKVISRKTLAKKPSIKRRARKTTTTKRRTPATAKRRAPTRKRTVAKKITRLRKPVPKKWVIKALVKRGESYSTRYFNGSTGFENAIKSAKKYASKQSALNDATRILRRLPSTISHLTVENV